MEALKTLPKSALLVLAALLLAFLAGRFSSPKKTEIHEVEKVVYKDHVIEDREKEKTKTETEIRRPDGTVERVTTETEKRSNKKEEITQLDKQHELTKTVENRPDWRLGVLYKPTIPKYQGNLYTLDLERRILGEIYVGVNASSDRTVGVSISIGF